MQPTRTQRIVGAPPPPMLRVLVATLICVAAGGGPRPACASVAYPDASAIPEQADKWSNGLRGRDCDAVLL